MSRIVYILPLLALCISTILGINTYIGSDGKSRYETALQCEYRSLYFAFYYNLGRTDFSARDDMDCCYLADTRNMCCLGNTGSGNQEMECRCNKSISCGAERVLPSTTMSPSTTSSTTTTTVPSTTTQTTTTPSTTTPSTTTESTTTESTTTASTTTTSTTTASTTTASTTTPSTTTASTTTRSTTTPSTTTESTTTSTTTTPTTTTASTTTTTETTTAPFRSLCSQSRALNGELVNDACVYSGIARIYDTTLPDMVMCNAIYTTADVNGEMKETFITLTFCAMTVTLLKDSNDKTFDLNIGKQTFPIVEPLLTLVDGEDGISFIEINPIYGRIVSDIGCQMSSCAYNDATMSTLVDFNDCLMVSYGASDAASQSQNGLNEVAVKLKSNGCGDIEDLFGANNTMCFTSVSGSNLFCSNDAGAPVYCRAPSNDELILIGVTVFQTSCDLTPEIKVIPIPN